jgi:hypothetical protein
LILPSANTECRPSFLAEVAVRHPEDRMVMEGAGWHRSQRLKPPANLYLINLPPYSPKLNPVENLGDDLREKAFGNVVFDSMDALETPLEASLRNLNWSKTGSNLALLGLG